jgi:hypothetical protein
MNRLSSSGEQLQAVLVRALAVLRAGDEIEARLIVSRALRAHERSEGEDTSDGCAEGQGRAGTSREADES